MKEESKLKIALPDQKKDESSPPKNFELNKDNFTNRILNIMKRSNRLDINQSGRYSPKSGNKYILTSSVKVFDYHLKKIKARLPKKDKSIKLPEIKKTFSPKASNNETRIKPQVLFSKQPSNEEFQNPLKIPNRNGVFHKLSSTGNDNFPSLNLHKSISSQRLSPQTKHK